MESWKCMLRAALDLKDKRLRSKTAKDSVGEDIVNATVCIGSIYKH